MNKHQLGGATKRALGRVQEHAGKTVGSPKQEREGLAKQGKGTLEKAYGDLKEALKNSSH